LRKSLAEGMSKGEKLDKMAARVEQVMGDRIRSSPETIARTEVNRASTRATLEAYRQSGEVDAKAWLSELSKTTRETNIWAHNRYQADPIPLNENFMVGAGSGPGPCEIGIASEDINCKCQLQPVKKLEL